MGLSEGNHFKFLSSLLCFLCIALACISSSCVKADDTHYYDFVLEEKNYTKRCATKHMLVVNGSFPGPEIRVHKGDTFFVTVHNQGLYGVTIHWHGVKQPRNPWYDGPEYITQCPIEPGTNFTYKVILSDEEGTLWWHAHSDWTRATVHGAIVILPPRENPYPFPKPDADQVLVIAAWYTGDVYEEVAESLNGDGSEDLPHSNGYAINGELGDFSPCSSDTTYNLIVDYGKTYLLRIVNAVMNAEMFFAIAQHNLTVVGTDGAYVKPFSSSFIAISPGQTMDVLITTNQSDLGRYYMACRQFSSEYTSVTGFDHSNGSAILNYRNKDMSTWSSIPSYPSTLPYFYDREEWLNFTSKFRSLASAEHPIHVPTNISTRMYIAASMNVLECPQCNNGYKLASSLNNVSWVNPSTDVLLAYYRNLSSDYSSDFPEWPPIMFNFTYRNGDSDASMTTQGTKVKVLNYNESVEIVFQGTDLLGGSVNHPMHLHGYSYYVVGRGYGNFDNETDPLGYNLVDPPEVNTFSVPKNGWTAMRFVASNPGVWFMHCHYDRHTSWGMDTVFIVKNGGTKETSIRDPPSYMPPCSDSSPLWLQQYGEADGDSHT